MKPHLHQITPTQTVVKVPSISLKGHYRTVRIRDDTAKITASDRCNCPSRLPCHHIREARDYLHSMTGLQAVRRALLYQLRNRSDPILERKLEATQNAIQTKQTLQWRQSLGHTPTPAEQVAALPSPRPLQAYEQLFQSP